MDNVFMENVKKLELEDYLQNVTIGRGNLGDDIPLIVYRLLEYSLREQLIEELGKEGQRLRFSARPGIGQVFISPIICLI